MPALVLCGQRTFLAGDDLRCYTVFAMLFRVLQFACIIPLIGFTIAIESRGFEEKFEYVCPGVETPPLIQAKLAVLYPYLFLSLVFVLVSFCVDVGMWTVSGLGTPTEPEKRSNLKILCHAKYLPMSVVRVLLAGGGIVLREMTLQYCYCDSTLDSPLEQCDVSYSAWFTLLIILITSQWAELAFSGLMVFYILWKALPSLKLSTSEERIKYCCLCCCTCCSLMTCCFCGGMEVYSGDFGRIALMLSDFLDNGGTLDVTASDIVAGLVMLARVQDERRRESREALSPSTIQQQRLEDELIREVLQHQEDTLDQDIENRQTVEYCDREEEGDDVEEEALSSSERKSTTYRVRHRGSRIMFETVTRMLLSPRDELDKLVIAEGARFMRLAYAVYTWLMYMQTHPAQACCLLCKSSALAAGGCRCCGRGTHYAGDNLCGLHGAALEEMGGLDESDIAYAQFKGGLVKTPYCIVIDHEWRSIVVVIRGTLSLEDAVSDLTVHPSSLEEWGKRCGFDGCDGYAHTGMLDCAEWIYNDLERHGILDKLLLDETSAFKDYTLRCCGHSLGAGIAAIISLFLRSRFSDLRCLCFSPPGCVLSENLANSCKDYLTSYILDSDIVGRLSLSGMETLRNDVLEMITRIRVSKYQALRPYQRGATLEHVAAANKRLLYQLESIPPSKFRDQLICFHELQREKKLKRDIVPEVLLPPGKIVHLAQTVATEEKSKGKVYTAIWADAADFGEIEIAANFLSDHDPHTVLLQLQTIAESFQLSSPYLPT